MRRTPFVFILLAVFLTGCLPGVIQHPAPELSMEITPFENGECPADEYGFRRCAEGSELYTLGCDRLEQAPASFGALTPGMWIAICTYYPYAHEDSPDPNGLPDGEYVLRGGGLFPELTRYVVIQDSTFQLIRNPEEFRQAFAPVESTEEALAFAIALTGVQPVYDLKVDWRYRYEVLRLEETWVETVPDGYLVHGFDYQFFGCGPHYHYAVDVLVTPDGKVSETGRIKLFRNPAEDGLCVD